MTSCSMAVSSLLLAAMTLAGTASSLLVMPKRNNGTLLAIMQLDSHSNEIDSGTTAYRFPSSTAAAWELVTPSDAFFLANQGSGQQQSRLSSQIYFQCCNLLQLLNTQKNMPFHLNLHFDLLL